MIKKINKNKMWGGRFSTDQDKIMIEMNSSVKFDSRFYTEDINASIAHAKMLAKTKIITSKEAKKIVVGLNKIKSEFESGKFNLDPLLEDIHMNIESSLQKKNW